MYSKTAIALIVAINAAQAVTISSESATAKCWIRMPTGCEKNLSETATPKVWFVDNHNDHVNGQPKNPISLTSCSASRISLTEHSFNTYCKRSDAEQHWGTSPPVHHQEAFTASLNSAEAWASYRAANTAHVASSKGLRASRTAAVMAYFASKTKAASAASAFGTAKSAQATAQGNFNDASTKTATAKGTWTAAVKASDLAKAAASAAVTKQGEVEKAEDAKIAAAKLAGETAVTAATKEATEATAASNEAKKGAAEALVTFNAAKADMEAKATIKAAADTTFKTAKKTSGDATAKAASDKSAAMLAHQDFITGWKSSHTTGNF